MDLILSEYLKNNTIFYFIIELKSAYIERYLCGLAEFKAHINPITVDFGLFLSFLHHHLHSYHPVLAHNHTKQAAKVPLPSHEGCGLNYKTLTHLRSEVALQPPLPFPKGCGRFIVIRQWIGGERNIRGDPGSGRPIVWCVSKTNYSVCRGHFPHPSFHPIPLTTLVPNASVSNNDMTGDHSRNDDMNPTEGLAAV